jgi:hypothetical protein
MSELPVLIIGGGDETVVLDGWNSPVTHGVDDALGRPARDFSDYARATAATGAWGT